MFQSHYERLELKFLVDEIRAERIRAQLGAYCTPDRHNSASRGRGRSGYLIRSLYLDTPALAFHVAKERGDPDRVKLRVRTYSGSKNATLEVKRRHSNVIEKRRAVIPSEQVQRAARGLLERNGQKASGVVDEFARIVVSSGACPTLCVRYEREAYESSVDHYARVTFDRDIQIRPTRDWDLFPDERGWCCIDDHWRSASPTRPVVLELKCESAVPMWMSELIRTHELAQTSFSKYSVGMSLTQWLRGGDLTGSRSFAALG